MSIEECKLVSTGQHVMQYSCEFVTYKDDWDNIKKEFNITDEELKEKIGQCLQMWAWADILDDVRAAIKYDEEVALQERIVNEE